MALPRAGSDDPDAQVIACVRADRPPLDELSLEGPPVMQPG